MVALVDTASRAAPLEALYAGGSPSAKVTGSALHPRYGTPTLRIS